MRWETRVLPQKTELYQALKGKSENKVKNLPYSTNKLCLPKSTTNK